MINPPFPSVSIGDEIDLFNPPTHCDIPLQVEEIDGDVYTFACFWGDYQLQATEDGIVRTQGVS